MSCLPSLSGQMECTKRRMIFYIITNASVIMYEVFLRLEQTLVVLVSLWLSIIPVL